MISYVVSNELTSLIDRLQHGHDQTRSKQTQQTLRRRFFFSVFVVNFMTRRRHKDNTRS